MRIKSPFAIEARYRMKRDIAWTGDKAHFTETCTLDTPHMIVNVRTTAATVQDDMVLIPIHAALEQRALLPTVHLVDAGYTHVTNLQLSTHMYGVDVVGPVADDPRWQARARTEFDHTQFASDWQRQVVTCPRGKQSVTWVTVRDERANAAYLVRFARADCAAGASREHCTRSISSRQLTRDTQERYTVFARARVRQQTE